MKTERETQRTTTAESEKGRQRMPSLKSLNFSDLIDQSRGEENMFDVEFIVLNKDWNAQGTLKAHKYFLAFISPVFRQQFFGALRNDDREVKVPDVSFPAFELMIRWGYTGDMAIIHSIGDSIRSTGSLTVICMYTYSTIELPLLYSTYGYLWLLTPKVKFVSGVVAV